MSKVVARLEDAGLVRRAPDSTDQRAVVVGLTDEGREIGNRLIARIDAYYEELFSGWSETDREDLSRLVVKLAHSADAVARHALSRASGYDWG
ncbi:MarR family winged helix-turn-helix transcriptional regulator [Microbacterium sp. UCD-TDU]|uniref:MarR family winged helix-turn-helix transcriptional regulator n=1 Tax=Microbacterium sp. UCD-TDU TaxID=1247714 RepID=UPI000345B4F3|nr:winged helix DNA-binding protein [Microbacterium sp. UCD-TDU]EYT57103.1 MarR family transcriptional regulator [Microbacterium sp. UCD-TDU]